MRAKGTIVEDDLFNHWALWIVLHSPIAVLSLLCFKNRHKMHKGNFGGHYSMSIDIEV